MKTFTICVLLAMLAFSQSPALGAPKPITASDNLDIIVVKPSVAQDLNRLDEVAKREEASDILEKRDYRSCVSTTLHLRPWNKIKHMMYY
jgi:hypothetical protein